MPADPFVLMVMFPFIERIWAAVRVSGTRIPQRFGRVMVPLLLLGVLAALVLVIERTIAKFEWIFLTTSPDSQTLMVALHDAVFVSGAQAELEVDVTAVVYMVTTLVWLLVALRFVILMRIVARAKGQTAH